MKLCHNVFSDVSSGLKSVFHPLESISMKKEIITHSSFLVAYFIFISLFRGWFEVIYLQLWIGGILGTLLLDVDHFIYVYFLRPHEVTSQRASRSLSKRELRKTLEILYITRAERTKLIFHTAYFQIIFLLFTFLIVTSSASLLGRGLVLAASLHLFIDQVVDFLETGSIQSWFKELPITLDKKQTVWYLVALGLTLLIFGFFL